MENSIYTNHIEIFIATVVVNWSASPRNCKMKQQGLGRAKGLRAKGLSSGRTFDTSYEVSKLLRVEIRICCLIMRMYVDILYLELTSCGAAASRSEHT